MRWERKREKTHSFSVLCGRPFSSPSSMRLTRSCITRPHVVRVRLCTVLLQPPADTIDQSLERFLGIMPHTGRMLHQIFAPRKMGAISFGPAPSRPPINKISQGSLKPRAISRRLYKISNISSRSSHCYGAKDTI